MIEILLIGICIGLIGGYAIGNYRAEEQIKKGVNEALDDDREYQLLKLNRMLDSLAQMMLTVLIDEGYLQKGTTIETILDGTEEIIRSKINGTE